MNMAIAAAALAASLVAGFIYCVHRLALWLDRLGWPHSSPYAGP
jgi:hypothetical protein